MSTNTVNISFESNLLKKIDKIAKEEYRTRSELIREAARFYIDRKNKWNNIFKSYDLSVKRHKFTQEDIMAEIKEHRKLKKVKN